MKKLILMTGIILMFTASALANEDKFYVGGGMGGTSFSGDRSLILEGADSPETYNISRADITGKIYAGYRFFDHVALEFGLHKFGSGGDSAYRGHTDFFRNVGYRLNDDALKTTYSSKGISLSLLGFFPVADRFEIFGRVGLLLSKVDSKNPDFIKAVLPGWKDFVDTGFAVLIGAGIEAEMFDNFYFRVETEWAPNIAYNHSDDTDAQIRDINMYLTTVAPHLPAFNYDLDINVISTNASINWRF